jgi:hypothetical protein
MMMRMMMMRRIMRRMRRRKVKIFEFAFWQCPPKHLTVHCIVIII